VRALAGDEGVNPFRRCPRQFAAGAAGDDADFFANARPAAQQHGWRAENGF